MFNSYNGVAIPEVITMLGEELMGNHLSICDRIDITYNYDYSIRRNLELLDLPKLSEEEYSTLKNRLCEKMMIKDENNKTACEKAEIKDIKLIGDIYDVNTVNICIKFDYDFESLVKETLAEIEENKGKEIQPVQSTKSYCVIMGSDDCIYANPLESIEQAKQYLGGEPKHIYDIPMPNTNPNVCPETHKLQVWCNKDYLTSESDVDKRFSVLGTAMRYGRITDLEEKDLLWGNMVVCGENADGSPRRLTELEKNVVAENFARFLTQIGVAEMEAIHKELDGKRPEPKIEMFTYGKDDFKDIIENATKNKNNNNLW